MNKYDQLKKIIDEGIMGDERFCAKFVGLIEGMINMADAEGKRTIKIDEIIKSAEGIKKNTNRRQAN